MTQDLTAAGGDCIDVSAKRTVLFLNGHKLSGNGSGVGVRFSARAKTSFLEGGNATISGFSIGVEDDTASIRATTSTPTQTAPAAS